MLQAIFSWYNTSSSVECTDSFCFWECKSKRDSTTNPVLNSFLSTAYVALLVLLPVAGWIGDSLFGRYRAITVGSFVAYLLILISFVMLQFDWTIPAFVVTCISLPAAAVGGGTFFISSLPFVIDQMIGASADDIIAAIQWYCWAFALGIAAQYLFLYASPL